MISPGYIHCEAHPDHGEPVTYAPGQALPDWVAKLLVGREAVLRPVENEPGVFDLVVADSPHESASAKPRKQVKK
jgi:hypothetical protein